MGPITKTLSSRDVGAAKVGATNENPADKATEVLTKFLLLRGFIFLFEGVMGMYIKVKGNSLKFSWIGNIPNHGWLFVDVVLFM
jgi:hypothetical protein